MLDDKQYANLLDDTLLPLLKGATGGDRAIVSVLVAILSELRTNREATIALQAKFDKVTAYGNAMITQVAR